jgi:hypothetical protein
MQVLSCWYLASDNNYQQIPCATSYVVVFFCEKITDLLFIIFNSCTRKAKNNKNYNPVLGRPSDDYKNSSEAALTLPHWSRTKLANIELIVVAEVVVLKPQRAIAREPQPSLMKRSFDQKEYRPKPARSAENTPPHALQRH